MDYKVRFITDYWDHHSAHSGYDQLVTRLGSAIAPININSLRDKWIPGRIAVWLATNSGNKLYSYLNFYHEWAAIREMLLPHPLRIYHVLYGDYSLRYLGSLGKNKNSRIVATYHLPPSALREYLTSLNYLKKLDGLIVVGRNQISFFESVMRSERIFFVPHGVDTNIFSPRKYINTEKGTRGICLFVGLHRRDFVTLRRVIEIVNSFKQEILFKIVTKQGNFKLFEGLNNVDLMDGVPEPELVRLYQTSDLLIQPLEDSTANNAILEGMSCGLPIVATDIGGVRDYIDEKSARLVPTKNAEAMAQAVMDLLENESTRKEMSINARANAIQFDWSNVTKSMQQVYSQVLEN
jgi:glycosyltransferase involved in cell wall biosynthesis